MYTPGLPRLNRLAAARRIRALSPKSKLIFVTQESSADVAGEALNLGAKAYVGKTMLGSDLPAALDAVLDGGQFVSDGLSGQEFATPTTASRH